MKLNTVYLSDKNQSKILNNIPLKPQSSTRLSNYNSHKLTPAKHVAHSTICELNFEFDDTAVSNHTTIKNRDKFPIHLLLIVPVILAFSLIVYLYYPSNDNMNIVVGTSLQQSTNDFSAEKKLEKIANMLVESKTTWNSDDINSFISIWNNLAKPIRSDLTDTVWYELFAFAVAAKLKHMSRLDSDSALPNETSAGSILTLAFTLDVVKSDQFFTNRRTKRKKFSQLLAKIKSEISQLDSAKRAKTDNKSASILLNNVLRQEFEVSHNEIERNRIKTRAKINKKAKINPPQTSAMITGDDIRMLLDKFKAAYINGDISAIQTIFFSDERSDSNSLRSDLLDSYKYTFDHSVSRSINLSPLKWQYHGDIATGTGKYHEKINIDKNNHTTKTITADVEVELQLFENKIKFSKLLLKNKATTLPGSNSMVSVESNMQEMPFLAAKEVPKLEITSKPPSKIELNNVVDNFISAYESGNIDLLISLLSTDIKTNDKFNRKEIKQDYINLFASSSKRKMSIKNLKWKFKNNHAKGTGTFLASMLTPKNNTLKKINGKIQIVAKRIDGQLRITHLYHLERNL